MENKTQFKTGAFGIEFVDENKAANHDRTVLPHMVNAKIEGKDKEDDRQR